MFRERHDNTVIHASHIGNYMLHAQGSETQQTYTFRLLKGKQRTSVTFQTDGNIQIALHVCFAINCRTRHLTLRRRIKSHLLFAGIIRSSPFSLR